MMFLFRFRSSCCVALLFFLASNLYADRRVESLREGWRFTKGEQPPEAANLDYDDSTWQAVRVPHDWAIAGPFHPDENGYAGKLPWRGVGWYRRVLTLDSADRGKQVYLDFDGVMAFPKVYVNGRLAGEWDYGYMSFRVNATPYVKWGEKNVIAVQADTRKHGTRWYPGAGIYRKVTMTVCDPVHIAPWGTYVTTPEIGEESATVRVRSSIENHSDSEAEIEAVFELFDPQGRFVARESQRQPVPAGGSAAFDRTMTVPHPRLWDVVSPNLYTVRTTVRMGDRETEVEAGTFGIRSFEFTGNDGFHLNGRRVQLYGACLHHDQGPLGAAFYPRAMERQLEILRDMGCNAIRSSHNPPAPELLDLCDRMGFVVWDECFDKWDSTADRVNGEPLEEYGEKQIRQLVMRDRNHPSIVVWSIGNEISGQPFDKEGVSPERVKFMSDFVRKYDPTRPVALACQIPELVEGGTYDSLDLTGWNYSRRYAAMKEKYPDKPILYSESASALSTAGFYELPLPESKTDYAEEAKQVDSYDHNAANWSDIPDIEFQLMEDDRFVGGEFVWTGFDYLGEPTPFTREAKSSYFGIVDFCGIPKDRFYLYRSYWRPETATVHILPHWNWPNRVRQGVPVYVYTNGDSAELFLNGKSLGRRTKKTAVEKPVSLALNKPVRTGCGEAEGREGDARGNDGDLYTGWSAAGREAGAWWQVDLGDAQKVGFLDLTLQNEARNYQYVIQASTDGTDWETLVTKEDRSGAASRVTYEVDTQARFVRIRFAETRRGTSPGFWEFAVYPERVENPYYAVLDKYRLRWLDVAYEPGELKAVAYQGGRPIGEATVRTAQNPSAVRITPDRTVLDASGDDLSYVLVEAVDEDGTLCPLADSPVRFEVSGPAEIAAVGNGDPLSLEPFQADSRKLFCGKAMLILRTKAGQKGEILVTAKSDGLREGQARLAAE